MDPKVSKQFRINRINPENLKPLYVNDLIVTHTKKEFFVTFSQIESPAILPEDGFDNIDSVDSIAQAKIIVTPEFFKKIIELLQTNYKNFLEQDLEEGDAK
jgi:hypothetical protein